MVNDNRNAIRNIPDNEENQHDLDKIEVVELSDVDYKD